MRLLRVTAEDRAEITAERARLHVLVEGETFVMGNAALEGAREVRELAAGLREAGVPPGDLQVRGLKLSSSSGLLLKNQKVEFALRAEVTPARLPAALGAVAAQKNARLRELEWVFDEFEASIGLAAQAMQRARRKAEAIAAAAGHSVTGVHNASDSWDMPVAHVNLLQDGAGYAVMRARQAESLDVGVEYTATQTLTVRLTVDFTLE